jgi:1-acyl-sn-glycerol-3-phosphate acyltransferase
LDGRVPSKDFAGLPAIHAAKYDGNVVELAVANASMPISSENSATSIDPNAVRALIQAQVANFVAANDAQRIALAEEAVHTVLVSAEPKELRRLLERLTNTGSDWEYQGPDPLARRLSHALAELVFEPGSRLEGQHHLALAERESLTFVVNHLSYSDANVIECLLVFAGFRQIADRLTVLAGPKVFVDPYRRLMSLCFGSIKTPQSSSIATGEAVMSKRDVAAAAASALRHFETRRDAGDHLLIFVEGSRSRTASMQPALPAVSRYVEKAGVTLLPVGVTGSEHLVPIGEERVHPTQVVARIGEPIASSLIWERARSKRRLVMDVVGLKIAALLPPAYRGVYASGAEDLREAHEIALALSL